MPTQYSPSLRLALPVQGELSGTWGDVVNDNITKMVEEAVAGYESITLPDSNYTLVVSNGVADEARNMYLKLNGTLTATREVICPTASKLYFVWNNTSQTITFKTSAGTGVNIPTTRRLVLQCDGTNVIEATTRALPEAGGIITGNLTVSGTVTLNGNVTIGDNPADTCTFTSLFNSDNSITLSTESTGLTVLTQASKGVRLAAGGMNTTSKYAPPLFFASTDAQFVTQNPKSFAAIAGYASETFSTDMGGGGGLEFFTTPNNPGVNGNLTARWAMTQDGHLVPSASGVTDLGSATNTLRGIYTNFITVEDGSASQPSIRFTNDSGSNTGFYRINENEIGVATAAVLTLYVGNGPVAFPRISTTASAANAFLNSGSSPANSLLRSTSSIRYKDEVQSLTATEAEVLGALRPVTYRSKAEADDPSRRWFGLIAEEVAQVEPRLVHYMKAENGSMIPDGVQYDRIVVLLLHRVNELTKRLQALEGGSR